LTTLGPLALTLLGRPSVKAVHFEKESSACARPEPTVTLNARDECLGVSEPEKVSVWTLAVGGGARAALTIEVTS